MKAKATLIFGILALLICGAAWMRWGYKTAEITLSQGPVAKVSATDTETILELSKDQSAPVKIRDLRGIATISRAPGLERLILSQEGIKTNDGKLVMKWRDQKRYVPARSFRVYSGQVYLGRLEMTDGTTNDYYISRQ